MKQLFYRVTTAAWNSGLPLPGADRGDCISIICLHGVHTPEMEQICPPPTSSVSAASFEANMVALAKHHRIISLGEAVAMLAGRRPWQPRCAVLTFDDSLKCTADVAFPILSRLGLTATVFVSSDAIETALPYWWLRVDHAFHKAKGNRAEVTLPEHGVRVVEKGNITTLSRLKSALRRSQAGPRDAAVASLETQLDARLENSPRQFPYATTMVWEDVRQVIKRGFSVGSHTVTHPNLAILTKDQAREELSVSKKAIEAQTGLACLHFCYPYGAFTPEVAAIAADCGYEAATCTVGPGRNRAGQDLFALRRYSIPAAPRKLGYMLTGIPEVIARSKSKLGRSNGTASLNAAASNVS